MLRILSLAIGDLGDRRVLSVLVRSLVVTLLIFAGLAVLTGWLLTGADPCGWLTDDSCPLDASTGGLGSLLLTALAFWFLFPAVALGVVSAYVDRIVAAVEARHYPAALTTAKPLGYAGAALLGLRSSARLILYNLIALPLYLILLVTGIGPLILFVIVNGLAVGRDFGELAAARHGTRQSRKAWLKATRGERAVIGILVAALFLVPFVNLIAPILGAAMAAHLFHRTASDRPVSPAP